ncbi:hypothetical protein HOL21_03875 [Candidatus Woesearchaeota archaeon]|jgi:large subunit ribosomal protein L32e|nr:hypothetical protein [Candidatus Woesearchaeota archaeon]MBT5397324.1 hypothetical protein [Candidatus Woesearchaeota archaeon]MBT5924805.1 hypothetical protein [Candidatus Woesearchaeota archaeon]MBT6367831.1 hypothetical protein [Candidatus Woesearchaeota archaeon]MBT7762724.1 hypothetical protein [Candidatus Woesearchaeota archaeon]
MVNEKALQLRKSAKKRKPNFVVKESKFTSGVKKRWRFPRGKHSAVRQHEKGRPALPQPGYGSPASVRGLHSSGLKPIIVSGIRDMNTIDPKTEGAVIRSVTGQKKKVALIKLAQEKNITLLNMKDPSAYVEDITKKITERKKLKEVKLTVKSKKEEARKKKAEEKAQKEKEKESKESDKESEASSVEDTIKDTEDKKNAEKTITKRQ